MLHFWNGRPEPLWKQECKGQDAAVFYDLFDVSGQHKIGRGP